MTDAQITSYSLIAGFVVYSLWDVYVAFFNKESNSKDTISGVTYGTARKFSALPLMLGAIIGHLLWPAGDSVPQPWFIIAGILSLSLIAYQAHKYRSTLWKFRWMPIVWFMVGVPHGHLFWPQVVR